MVYSQMELQQNNSICTKNTIYNGYCYDLPICGYCYDYIGEMNSNEIYELYNFILISIILPIVGLFGLCGNGISAFIYSRKSMRSSMNIYLCALAFSDITIIVTAFFLFFIENFRHKSLFLSRLFAVLAPATFPLGLTAQSLSVFLTVTAAVDCYILVSCNFDYRRRFCTTSCSFKMIGLILMLAILYNSPHILEITVINCWNVQYAEKSIDICPTDLRQSQIYFTVYYAWMYTAIMAIGPILILTILNSLIIFELRKSPTGADSDVLTLILVVCLFVTCNVLPLTVNFLELLFGYMNAYLIDLSNLMVVINSSSNFLIYYAFGDHFRKTLKEYLKTICQRKSKKQCTNNGMITKAQTEMLI